MTIRDLINWERPFNIPISRSNDLLPSFASLQEDMNRLFERFYRGSEVYLTNWDKATTIPAVNIAENGNSFRIEAELPGMPPESIDVSVSGNMLTIKGEKKEEKEEKDENYIRRESSYGSVYRQIILPEAANGEKADASFKNGVLTVTVPKKAEAVQQSKKLQIKKAA
ncbi:MAG: Hsp20/alpha crystallin family protein [Proteobacteria bacterium]|nr:Hsp20/alpha crystallin family protein [Pseudomonadota bacterium]